MKEKKKTNKLLKFLANPVVRTVVGFSVFIVIVLAVFLGTSQKLPFTEDKQFFVVMSGSMEPSIKTGSMVLVDKSYKDFKENDVITFNTPRTKKTVTHRITTIKEENIESSEVKQTVMSTKGDANTAFDPWVLLEEHIVGKVKFSIPYIGYLVNFSKTPKGFILIVVVPGLLIVFDEIMSIKKAVQGEYKKKIKDLEDKLEKEKASKEAGKAKKAKK